MLINEQNVIQSGFGSYEKYGNCTGFQNLMLISSALLISASMTASALKSTGNLLYAVYCMLSQERRHHQNRAGLQRKENDGWQQLKING